MGLTPSTMLALGTWMPTFVLPDTNGKTVSAREFSGAPLVVVFICPHCPFVKHIRRQLAQFADDYRARGLAVVAINSNDTNAHPEDDVAGMAQEIAEAGYRFPYLFDESQQTAKAYQAACTPDFFLFDRTGALVYRGQFDDSRPGKDLPVTGADLRAAAEAVLAGARVSPDQKPSIGCNVKWKPGNAP